MVLSAKVVSPHVFFFFVSYFHGKQLKVMSEKVSYPKLRETFKPHISWAGLE